MMQCLLTFLFGLFFLGLFTNHIGAGLLAGIAAVFFVWANDTMDKNEKLHNDKRNNTAADIKDDDFAA